MAINYTISYTFSPSTVISSSQVNQNFQDNANTWTGLEALTKSFSHLKVDNDPASALEVATKQYVDNSVTASIVGAGKNRILNGAMLFDQNKEGGAYSTSGKAALYTLDQWRVESTGTPDFSVTRVSVGPQNNFFTNSLQISSVTSPGSPSASDGCNLEYPMDPVYQTDWGWGTSTAKTVTLSFWALSSLAGTYSISLLNGLDTRSYVTTYTLPTNTWTFVTVTVPGDITGPQSNWPTTGIAFGLKTVWDLGSGSTVTTSTLNTWQAGSFWKATGSANFISGANTFLLTGVQLEIGSSATSFEVVPYTDMLLRLQRYYWKTFPQGVAVGTAKGYPGSLTYLAQIANATAGYGMPVRFPVEQFGNPSFPITPTFYSPTASNAKWYNSSTSADSGTANSAFWAPSGCFILNPQVSGDGVGQTISVHMVSDARPGGN